MLIRIILVFLALIWITDNHVDSFENNDTLSATDKMHDFKTINADSEALCGIWTSYLNRAFPKGSSIY